jgi:hypothetical protein
MRGILGMHQVYGRGILGVLQGCIKGVSRVYKGCTGGVWRGAHCTAEPGPVSQDAAGVHAHAGGSPLHCSRYQVTGQGRGHGGCARAYTGPSTAVLPLSGRRTWRVCTGLRVHRYTASRQVKLSVRVTGHPEILETEGLLTQGSSSGRSLSESVGGIFGMDSSDWSNGIRYHIFYSRPDTEFKLAQ